MLYKIHSIDQIDVLSPTTILKSFSFDGKFTLVQTEDEVSVALESYQDSELQELLKQDLWKQPCFNC